MELTSQQLKIVTSVIWLMALFVFWVSPSSGQIPVSNQVNPLGLVTNCTRSQVEGYFPWQVLVRFKKLAWKHYKRLRDAHRRALRMARMSKVLLTGAITIARLTDIVTRRQRTYDVGALPVLYDLLDRFKIDQIINRHCPSNADIDHGKVALVMILCRQTCPKPLYKVADWYSESWLRLHMGIKAKKLNDDRLGRMLEAISDHQEEIWHDIIGEVLLQTDIDLSVVFYDLSAFVAHGAYKDSKHIDYGFAHNTPSNKQKFKLGLNSCSDGNLPLEYRLLNGRSADKSTVEENLQRCAKFLKRHGCPTNKVMLIGDRAMLSDELAFAYDHHKFRYLAGLKTDKNIHKKLLTMFSFPVFERLPLTDDGEYFGRVCQVPFEHNGKKVTHQGLVVLSMPIKNGWQETRRKEFLELETELIALKAKVGKPRYRTEKALTRSINARLKKYSVGKLMMVNIVNNSENKPHNLEWQIDNSLLKQAERRDGRYLLVTNDNSLSPDQMLELYRSKDGGEKNFHIAKNDLNFSPIYLHKDNRIEGMLLINMIALLFYRLLERQTRLADPSQPHLTTRRIIERLENLSIIQTTYFDDSCSYRLTDPTTEQLALFQTLALVLQNLNSKPTPALLTTDKTVDLSRQLSENIRPI